MKYSIILFVLLIGRVPLHLVLTSESVLPATKEIVDYKTFQNYQSTPEPYFPVYNLPDSIPKSRGGEISVMDFGAKCDGITDDIIADSTACAYCIAHPFMCSTVIFPVGHTRITRPLLLQNKGNYFTIHLRGMLPAKEASDQYLSEIIFDSKSGFGIGIQNGRGIIIENLAILGKYSFPYSVNNHNIGTLRFADWVDPTISDSRSAPYAGICIDPNQGNGTSGVEIRQCSIKQFMVGICLSPVNTVNDEMINIIDDDIEAVRVAIAIGQDQSKEIHIDRLKAWASVHTILDGLTYGRGTGGGSVDIEGGNFAGNINELFNLNTDRFPLSCKDIYSESLFRIGQVGQMANFINTQIDFLTGVGMPAADYLISGSPNFYGGMLRYYDGDVTHRLNLNCVGAHFRDMTFNNQPITVGLYGYGSNVYPVPHFDNVRNYYHNGLISNTPDSIIPIRNYVPSVSVNVDRIKWVSTISGRGIGNLAKIGDYVLGAPCNVCGKFWDKALNPNSCNTMQIGRVYKVATDTLYLNDVGLNIVQGNGYDAYYLSRLK